MKTTRQGMLSIDQAGPAICAELSASTARLTLTPKGHR